MTKNREIYGEHKPLKATEKPKRDKHVEAVVKKFRQRSRTGIEKYGTTLERSDIDIMGWLTHLQEELMDACNYIEKLKDSYEENIPDSKMGQRGKR